MDFSDRADDETLPRRLDHSLGDFVETVDFENPLDLGQQSVQ